MTEAANTPHGLEDLKVNVKIKLSALWASVMLCYIYADYFGLYEPGKVQDILNSQFFGVGPTTQGVLLGASLMLAIPSLMIFLSVALPPVLNRWLNIVAGAAYTAIILNTMWGWVFYIFYGVIEISLTSLVVWYAWRWPKTPASTSVTGDSPGSLVRARRPNMRVQRTRSSPSALRSPLTRCPLGGGYRQLASFGRPSLLKLPAHPVGRVADMDIALAGAAVQARDDRFAGLLRCRSVRNRYEKPAPTRGTTVAVAAIDPGREGTAPRVSTFSLRQGCSNISRPLGRVFRSGNAEPRHMPAGHSNSAESARSRYTGPAAEGG